MDGFAAIVPEGVEVFSVSALTARVRMTLEEAFPSVWVTGEVSNLARPASGHVYLTLKDAGAQLRAVIYRGVAFRLKFDPRDGLEVLVRGRMYVYQPRGEYQLVIEELHPKGIGALELALRQLKEKLSRKGYFRQERKRSLPRFPRRIGIVTSATGAAIRDMLEILGRRWPLAEVIVRPTRVQGEGAAEEIAAAIDLLNQVHQPVNWPIDVILVGRGGGSIEDLWAFNEEIVADAIFRSQIPIVSAVGHETDFTIADLVADQRAATPTHAATAVVPDRQEWWNNLHELRARLHEGIRHRLELARRRLDDLAQRRAFRLPLDRIREAERKLDDTSERLQRAGKMLLERANDRLAALAGRLATLSPLNVLARGYTLTKIVDQPGLLRDATAVPLGTRLLTQTARGSLVSRVEEVRPPSEDNGFSESSGTTTS